jgi:HSP20 family protein
MMLSLMKPTGSMDPFALMDDVRRSLWSDPFTPRFAAPDGPRMVAREHEGGLRLQADVPGLRPDDLKVEAEGEYLNISGERSVAPPDGYRELRRERATLRFARRLRVGRELDASGAQARFEEGVLTIDVPRRPELTPRQIPIQTG